MPFLLRCYTTELCSKEVQRHMEIMIVEISASRKTLGGNKRVKAQYMVRFAVYFRNKALMLHGFSGLRD